MGRGYHRHSSQKAAGNRVHLSLISNLKASVPAGFGRHPHCRESGAPRAFTPFAGISQLAILRYMSGNSADISKGYFEKPIGSLNPLWSANCPTRDVLSDNRRSATLAQRMTPDRPAPFQPIAGSTGGYSGTVRCDAEGEPSGSICPLKRNCEPTKLFNHQPRQGLCFSRRSLFVFRPWRLRPSGRA